MIDFLHDHRFLVLVISLGVWAWLASAWVRSRAALATAGAGRAPVPGTGRQPIGSAARKDIAPQQRTSTGGLAPSIEAGVAEHKVRGSAATAKLDVPTDQKRKPTESLKPVGKAPPPPPTPEQLRTADKILPRTPATGAPVIKSDTETKTDDDAAMEGLFSGLKDQDTEAPAEQQGGPGTRAIRKANRLEEIGFHHQIESEKLPAQPPAPPAVPAPAAQKPPTTSTPAPAPAAPPKPRSQTAELDDILKRIDKVLAENPTPADKAAAPPPPPPPAPKPTEKLDPSDVLKRIDEALAESRGGTEAEVTMLDPDWEDDAKRAHTEPSTVESKSADPAPKPAAPKTEAKDDDVPDWAKQDAEDEKDTKDDGKGGGQQKLF